MNHLFFLPFDHRASFATALLGFPYPPKNAAERKTIMRMKRVVYDAAVLAGERMEDGNELAILVDEEFDGDILSDARSRNLTVAMTVEKSGEELFAFEYGERFGQVLAQRKPDYAKALIRWNVADRAGNALQKKRLKRLNDWCRSHHTRFLLEVLLTGRGSRFVQMKKMIAELEQAGVKPHVWKLEGLEYPAEWKAIRRLTQGDLIILGHGEDQETVARWVKVGAQSGVVRGFAVGRTVFFRPLVALRDKKISPAEARRRIADTFLRFVRLFERFTPSL